MGLHQEGESSRKTLVPIGPNKSPEKPEHSHIGESAGQAGGQG